MSKRILIEEFCDKYKLDRHIVLNYVDCVQLGDLEGMDVYFLIIMENTPDLIKRDVKVELRELLKKYFKE